MIGKKASAAALIACLLFPLFLSSCGDKFAALKRLDGGTADGKSNPSTVIELEAAVLQYQKVVDEKVHASDRISYYYKMLGIAYLERKMYGEAMKAFNSAIEISPVNASLFYNAGLCAAYMSKAEIGLADGSDERRLDYLSKAERAYKRALEIEPDQNGATYGLAVLYVFEMNRPDDAVPYLQRYMAKNKNDFNSRFVMARVLYLQKKYDEAVSMYEEIIRLTGPENLKQEARDNRDAILNQADKPK